MLRVIKSNRNFSFFTFKLKRKIVKCYCSNHGPTKQSEISQTAKQNEIKEQSMTPKLTFHVQHSASISNRESIFDNIEWDTKSQSASNNVLKCWLHCHRQIILKQICYNAIDLLLKKKTEKKSFYNKILFFHNIFLLKAP